MRCGLVVAAAVAVGAFVGYATNRVAVWLLFHPVRPFCLLGRRLCVWGVVPARRRELARRLAGLVEEYLATGAVFARMEEEMRRAVVEEVRRLASSSPFAGLLGLEAVVEPLGERLASLLSSVASGLVRRVDIQRVVEEELARMSPVEAERMFRSIAGRELGFVVYSGLVLGGLVGLVQGLLLCLLG